MPLNETISCVDFDDLDLSFVYPNRFSYVKESWTSEVNSPSIRQAYDSKEQGMDESTLSTGNEESSQQIYGLRASSDTRLELIQEKPNLIEVIPETQLHLGCLLLIGLDGQVAVGGESAFVLLNSAPESLGRPTLVSGRPNVRFVPKAPPGAHYKISQYGIQLLPCELGTFNPDSSFGYCIAPCATQSLINICCLLEQNFLSKKALFVLLGTFRIRVEVQCAFPARITATVP